MNTGEKLPRIKWERLSPRSDLDAAWYSFNVGRHSRTPKARGLAALKEPKNIERLSRCDAAAKAGIKRRLAT